MKRFYYLCLFACLFTVVPLAQTNAQTPKSSGYHILKKVKLGGDGGWDYLTVDPQARRLYISRGTHVMVVDADTGALTGDIPNTPGVHGIAVAPEFNMGFTSNGRGSSVTAFDLKTLKPIKQIPAGKNPDAIIYDPVSKRMFSFNGASKDTTVIDAKTGTVAGTIALGGKPEFAVADGKGTVFVNIEDKSEVLALDPGKLAVMNHWPLAPCEEPSGMAMDKQNRRLFVVCSNNMMGVINADNGHVVTTLTTAEGADASSFDSDRALAFSSNGGSGTLTVVHEDTADKFSVVDNITTQKGARTMAFDPKTHNVFLVTSDFGPPPAPTSEHPHPRPTMVPGSFTLLIVGK
jgi:YVTN family beta-propeller protein